MYIKYEDYDEFDYMDYLWCEWMVFRFRDYSNALNGFHP